jgi:hypothetical protein
MMTFEMAAGSVIGYDHVRRGSAFIGRNNQDAYTLIESPENGLVVGVVCDGCGGGERSEIGAVFMSQLVANWVLDSVLFTGDRWKMVEDEAINGLYRLMCLYRPLDPSDILLTTVFGFLINEDEERVTIFYSGDGFYGINSEIVSIESPIENTPPYMAYQIIQPNPDAHAIFVEALGDHPYGLTTLTWPMSDVNTVVVASDGLRHMVGNEGIRFPSRATKKVPSVFEMICTDAIFRNPFGLGNMLNAINNDGVKMKDGRPKRVPGLLLDDTTIIIARRRIEEGGVE